MNFTKLLFAIAFIFSINSVFAQEPKKDENKIQEVVAIMADPITMKPNEDGSFPADTNPPKGMNRTEILKRAVNFVKIESRKYNKVNGVTTSNKAECMATFLYKPKELNPAADVQGTITMHLSIEAKDGKYRYIISKVNHNAKNTEYSGGDVFNEISKAGSMILPTDLWKRIKSEALKQANVLANDLKEAMKISSTTPVNADEW